MRTPPAAKTLTRQVRDGLGRKPDSKAGEGTSEPSGEVDGFGTYRSLTFDKTASKFLLDCLESLAKDRRIENIDNESGVVTVTFVATSKADQVQDFDLTPTPDESD